jgi:YggT family protein
MFVLSNFIDAITEILRILLNLYMWIIIIRALISWVSPDPYNPIVQILYRITDPVLSPLRRIIPMWRVGIDLSPLIAILIIIFLQIFLVASLHQLAVSLGKPNVEHPDG